MPPKQPFLDLRGSAASPKPGPAKHHPELIVDNFAGGGGASTGIELALGRCSDIAINHCGQALAMHEANHPHTHHLREDVFKVDPAVATGGRRVGLAWFSPDCTHFSKAKGGKPRSKKIRGLAWVMVKWGATVRPRVMVLENVEEFKTWGPLLDDGTPCPQRKGKTFKSFVKRLQNLGYEVDWRELRACDYGAPTIRKRLFLIARCDGRPIVWPQATHAAPKTVNGSVCEPVNENEVSESGSHLPTHRLTGSRSHLLPWKTAAECIDWSLDCPSIFLTPAEARAKGVHRPLAEATMRRIARGMFKFVINASEPFIVPLTHQGSDRVESVTEPMRTITGAHRGERAIITPTLIQTGYGERDGQAPRVPGLDKPLGTVVAGGGKHALVSAFLAKHFSERKTSDVHAASPRDPLPTVTARDHNALVSANLVRNFGQSAGADVELPLPTTTAGGGGKTAIVTSHLSKLYGTTTGQALNGPLHTITGGGNHIAEVRAFLIKYYSDGGQLSSVADPLHTITVKERMGLVKVEGADYAIVDIGMRMLKPSELFLGQGFPSDYIIAPLWGGKPLTEEAQVRMCGNSVPPPMAAAIVKANALDLAA